MSSELPYNLSSQFNSFFKEKPSKEKKVQKNRNKKTKEIAEYDILQIDEQIKISFEYEISKISEYKQCVLSMVTTLSKLEIPFGIDENILVHIKSIISSYLPVSKSAAKIPITYKDFLDFYNQLNKLIIKIENIESNKLYNKYIELTSQTIADYKNILAVPIKTVFLAKKTKNNNEAKKTLLSKYLKICSNFIDIDNTIFDATKSTVNEKEYKCSVCSNTTDFDTKDGWKICEYCGLEIPTVTIQPIFKDLDRINMHNKYRYETRSHFGEGISQYQGKQNKYIDTSVYIKGDKWLRMHNLLVINSATEELLKTKYPVELPVAVKRERYKKVTKDHLRLFLSESEDEDLTKHYEDIHLIYSNLTGIPCADISHLEEKLYTQFDKLVEAFFSLEEVDRVNILNTNFVLKNLLHMNKYITNPQDFPSLKTLSRLQEHQQLFELLCQKAGLSQPDFTKRSNREF